MEAAPNKHAFHCRLSNYFSVVILALLGIRLRHVFHPHHDNGARLWSIISAQKHPPAH